MIRSVAPRGSGAQPRCRAKRITARTSPGVVYDVSTCPGELDARLTRSIGPVLRGLAVARAPGGGSVSNATVSVTTRRPLMSYRLRALHWYATPSTTIRRAFDFMKGMVAFV